MHQVDVAILGGGLAGNLLARQLRRFVPNASVALFERDEERGWKVGESTVEIAATYLTKRLGLGRYLYEQHLPKNGLRFFFDTPDRDAELTRMSEIGLRGLPPYPSFQLDRARLERDLLEMNREDGVDVQVGVRVSNVVLSDDGGAHRFHVTREGGEQTEWSARWVVDAAGRAGVLSRLLDLKLPEREHRIAAAWGRVTGLRDMDDIDAPHWRERARYTARSLSTNHFCYRGQWLWAIPLGEGVTSVGAVMEAPMWSRALHDRDGFVAYLNEHRAFRDLMDGAELHDHQFFTQLAFRTRRFYGQSRWACVGDAAAFTDPFYSPGSDFIAIENDQVADLIARDLAGEDVGERAEAYDEYMQLRFEATLLLYTGQYQTFGSFELFRAKVRFDCACYYHLWFDSYMLDEHVDLKAVNGLLRRKEPVLEAMQNFSRLFRRTAERLLARGDYYRKNTDHWVLDGREAFGPLETVGEKRRRPEIDRHTESIFNLACQMVAPLLDETTQPKKRPLWAFVEKGIDLSA
jgi:flavin-dependent dehydrogenase